MQNSKKVSQAVPDGEGTVISVKRCLSASIGGASHAFTLSKFVVAYSLTEAGRSLSHVFRPLSITLMKKTHIRERSSRAVDNNS